MSANALFERLAQSRANRHMKLLPGASCPGEGVVDHSADTRAVEHVDLDVRAVGLAAEHRDGDHAATRIKSFRWRSSVDSSDEIMSPPTSEAASSGSYAARRGSPALCGAVHLGDDCSPCGGGAAGAFGWLASHPAN